MPFSKKTKALPTGAGANRKSIVGHKIEALVVYSNHVHLLARPHRKSIEEIGSRYKSVTTRILWEHGRKGRIWTRGYDKRFCFYQEDIDAKIKYIKKH